MGFQGGRFWRWMDRETGISRPHLLLEKPNCQNGSTSIFNCQWQSRQLGSGVCGECVYHYFVVLWSKSSLSSIFFIILLWAKKWLLSYKVDSQTKNTLWQIRGSLFSLKLRKKFEYLFFRVFKLLGLKLISWALNNFILPKLQKKFDSEKILGEMGSSCNIWNLLPEAINPIFANSAKLLEKASFVILYLVLNTLKNRSKKYPLFAEDFNL